MKKDECKLTGRVVTPKSPLYNKARQEWNRSIQKYPRVLVYCKNACDASNAICWSKTRCAPIRIRSGGHNYEGYSTGDGALVIDTRRLKGIRIDTCNDLVRVGGGVTNRELYDFLGARGYPFPGGTCPTVGLSGLSLGGGWGLSCRRYGLACDSLTGLELVDAEGRLLVANEACNPDLFWACRGAGGGNFGVVTSMAFRLPERVGKVTLVEILYPNAEEPVQEAFLDTWQKWLPGSSDHLTMQASIYNSAEEGMAIFARGIFYGTPLAAEAAIRPLLDVPGAVPRLQYLTFLEAITKIGNTYPLYEKFKSSGRFVFRQFGPDEIKKIVSLVAQRAEGSVFARVGLYALGGQVAGVAPADTAFFYRGAHYIILLDTVWEDQKFKQENLEWFEPRFEYLRAVTTGAYINFPFSGYEDYMAEYFGQNAARLIEVKKRYDPDNVFHFPQSIPVMPDD
jgi:FAD/FMN-containing dehydrogenase